MKNSKLRLIGLVFVGLVALAVIVAGVSRCNGASEAAPADDADAGAPAVGGENTQVNAPESASTDTSGASTATTGATIEAPAAAPAAPAAPAATTGTVTGTIAPAAPVAPATTAVTTEAVR